MTVRSYPPLIQVEDVAFFRLQMHTRFPFRYGIASMTEVPHLFVRIRVTLNGRVPATGIASEGLPPKWFTKDPGTHFETHDLPEMLQVIGHAAATLREAPAGPGASFFEWWQRLQASQAEWATAKGIPPLLANLGVALMERGLLDALCRGLRIPAWQAVRDNLLGIALDRVDPALADVHLSEVIPERPAGSIIARHTVGLGDPLTDAEIPAGERVADGLPQSLEACIRAYGLRHFKVKVCGDPESDLPRLRALAALLAKHAPGEFAITLDGNEQFRALGAFREQWQQLRGDTEIARMLERLLFVEQPLHRDAALEPGIGEELARWPDAPPFIIDESDADLGSLPRALAIGYSGTSHKNCKGIIKGIANAARLAAHSQCTGRPVILSGEDLANVGPVALLQDLSMVGMLGIRSVERNGHHYFRGLSMFPDDLQAAVLGRHADLYRPHPAGFAALDIRDGQLSLDSVNAAPFGTAISPDLEAFAQPLDL